MTLNGVTTLILRYFTEFDSQADYVTLVEDRPIVFANIVFQLYLAKTDPRSSRMISLRQLSLLLPTVTVIASVLIRTEVIERESTKLCHVFGVSQL